MAQKVNSFIASGNSLSDNLSELQWILDLVAAPEFGSFYHLIRGKENTIII